MSDEVYLPTPHLNLSEPDGLVVRACDVDGCTEHGSVRARVKLPGQRAPESWHLCRAHFAEAVAAGVAVNADFRPPNPLEAAEHEALLRTLRDLGATSHPISGGVLRILLQGKGVRDVTRTLAALVDLGKVRTVTLDEFPAPRYMLTSRK